MTGEIPTLQCKRCLCLYHPGCLGLPNQPYRNFFCSVSTSCKFVFKRKYLFLSVLHICD
jgi:hypothetical protein